ncbi:uncharacterized protein LDX57_008551 [Aspergillus melleus]|uniref:uncharacterized protein n=1 Tax=Aspergillus melleus TaxID=138277 RepID=UPI001E8E7DE8|nr:uncharacterized protein LDX57_008551 [Aspergillus melleus]KAH8430887.1 hypothetical protein LDX57_008551 [Aspergillus melleus]
MSFPYNPVTFGTLALTMVLFSNMLRRIGSQLVAIIIGGGPFPREVDTYFQALRRMQQTQCYILPPAHDPPPGWIVIRVDVDASRLTSSRSSTFKNSCLDHACKILLAIVGPRYRPVSAAVINGHPTFHADGTRVSEGNWITWGLDIEADQTGPGSISTFLAVPGEPPEMVRGLGKRRKLSYELA